jgi:anti-anti-sigma factor
MPPAAERRWLESEEIGGVTVVRFLMRTLRAEEAITAVFNQLDRLVVDGGCRKLVVNFGNVDIFASYAVGRLISLNRKVEAAGGRLALCSLTPVVTEIIDIMQLRRLLRIYATEQEALQSF